MLVLLSERYNPMKETDIRKYADSAECVVPREFWPYPSYGDLLFKI